MRLIDADEIKMAKVPYDNEISDYEKGWNDAVIAISENAETIDAVEVIRCKDCVRWNTILDRTKAEYGLCQIGSQLEATKNDDFCSRGERRTDDNGLD